MTLICTSGHRSRNNNGGTSPNRCTSPLDFVGGPNYVTIHQEGSSHPNSKNVDSPSSPLSSVLFGSGSPHTKTEKNMRRIEISFSSSSSSSSLESQTQQSPPRVPPDPKGVDRSISCVISGDRRNTLKKEMQIDLRSILKKAKSADSASIANLRKTLLESKCLSISLSDPSFVIDADNDDEDEPKSPNKNVTFADDNNLSLVKIHNFVPSNDKLDQWQFNCVFNQQRLFTSNRLSGNQAMVPRGGKKLVRKPNQLVVCFKEPCDSADFQERFKYKCVTLERCATRDRTITGIVLVKNIEFHKEVTVRYTLDSWVTSSDVDACYLPNSNDGETDRFSFSLALPRSYKEIEFAVRYKTESAEYWDNNFNRNYKVKDALTPF